MTTAEALLAGAPQCLRMLAGQRGLRCAATLRLAFAREWKTAQRV